MTSRPRWKNQTITDGSLPEAKNRRPGQLLAGMTIAWIVTVAVAAIVAGLKVSSIALIGLESALELLAAAIVIWQLSGGQEREPRAVRLIGVSVRGEHPRARRPCSL